MVLPVKLRSFIVVLRSIVWNRSYPKLLIQTYFNLEIWIVSWRDELG